jgi:23S rRNA pseudouridine955/2504/2580 synthase
MQKVQYITVIKDREGQRIDNYLLAHVGKIPKSLVYRWLRKGEVRVNKKRVKQTYRVVCDDIVRIPPVFLEPNTSEEKLKKLDFSYLEDFILYEDKDFIVMNKPTGLAVHGGSGLDSGLIERLRVLRPNEKKLELVHRLDRDTSGCILIAKKYSILTYFHEQLRERKVRKIYHALVSGVWPKSITKIDKPLKKFVPSSGERFVRVDQEGKASLTTTRVLEIFSGCTLVQASPHTGRTHQLRVHLQSVGHPILGDRKYSRRELDKPFMDKGLNRLFLHAYELTFIKPGTDESVTIRAEYDAVLEKVIKRVSKTKV